MKNRLKLIHDYHTHTVYSRNNHGKGTIEENVKVGIKKGLKTIGISDHGPSHYLYGIRKENFPIIRQEIDAMQKKYPEIEILFGVEANVISYEGDIDIGEDERKYLDFINLGFHNGVVFKNLNSFYKYHLQNLGGKLLKNLRKKAIAENTNAMIKAIEKNDIFIITHPGDKIPLDIGKLAKAAERTNTILEINDHHPHLSVSEIKIASNYRVKFSLGSDAHNPEKVGQISNAMNRMLASGIDINRVINVKEV